MSGVPAKFGLGDGDDGTQFLTARFFRDSGLLWKVNHDILHPLGLALAVGTGGDDGEDDSMAAVFRAFVAEDGAWEYAPEDNERKSADWDAFVQMFKAGLIDMTPPAANE